eukprot:465887-Amphidinium_carterae.1
MCHGSPVDCHWLKPQLEGERFTPLVHGTGVLLSPAVPTPACPKGKQKLTKARGLLFKGFALTECRLAA